VTLQLATTVAAYGLPTEHRFPDEPLDEFGFDALLSECEHNRVLGLLGTAVREGAFPVCEHQREEVEDSWQAWLAHAVRVERVLLDATEVLQAHEIRSRVLKGVALAHTVYADPSMRVFGDVDLLVEPANFTRAANVLIAELGATRPVPELRSGFDDRFGKEILLGIRDLEFDLHRMFVEGPFGAAIELGDLWEEPEPFALGGRELITLAPAGRTIHAAYAAALGDWPLRLNALRDFAQMWIHDRTVVANATELARRWRCEAVVGAAVARVREVFGLDLGGPSPEGGRALTARDRIFLRSYRGTGRGYLRNVVAPIAIPGVGNKVAFLKAVAFPDPAYLTARGTNRANFLRHGWARVRVKPGEP
jgi:hypothetical protein